MALESDTRRSSGKLSGKLHPKGAGVQDPLDQRAIFEFTKGEDVPAHVVWLCRKHGVTPQEVVHQFMRDEAMDAELRAKCAKWLLDELRPKPNAEIGVSGPVTVSINYVRAEEP